MPPITLILFGSPGSGKGTQSKLVRERCLQGPHISTGDMLRTRMQADDAFGAEIRSLMRAGRLVPDELVNRLVSERLAEPDAQSGVILDGYPRTLAQAGETVRMLGLAGMLPVVVHLVVDYDRIVARLSGRRQCPVCGTLYSLSTNPPKVSGVCDLDGATLVTREDDREEVIRERLGEYDRQTRPILEFFSRSGLRVVEVNGADADPAIISQRICATLDSLRATPAAR
jgi:adenylate kinase